MSHPLDAVALDGTAGQAYASHRARADGIARFFAETRKLRDIRAEQAGEDNVTTLIAHFHMLSLEPGFAAPGDEPSAMAAPAALRRLNRGNGLVGTKGAITKRDYDMAVKGLVVLLYRYRNQLGPALIEFIERELLPPDLVGGHPLEIEVVEFSLLEIDAPETENHLLMIESSRYLINQLRFDQTGDQRFDNEANGLTRWLLGFMQVIAKHDFLEFNARPYQRLAIHPLLNLQEFARDERVRVGATILLDYVMMKFAISSSRGRRVAPFRRLHHRVNHVANGRNFLYADQADEVAGFFLSYTGLLDATGSPTRFPESLVFNALLGALATYRPVPLVYEIALGKHEGGCFHRFYHGNRPRLPSSPDEADGGVEIYDKAPSYLISAGGSFLNSGYGRDEFDLYKQAWEQTSRAQAVTIIPQRADALFHDLVRFEPYPDPQIDPYRDDADDPDTFKSESVNCGVSSNFAAGANMRPAEHRSVLEETTSDSPALAQQGDKLFIAWKGSDNDNLNVGRVQTTSIMGIDGVEGIDWKTTLPETSDAAPAIASHDGRLFIAWRGAGNERLSLAFSNDDGRTFEGKLVLDAEESEHAPALVTHDSRLFLAWTGLDERLNVAKVVLFANTAGGFGIEGIEAKVTLDETSEAGPALASHLGRLLLAWKGSGNDNLNIAISPDGGLSFVGKATLDEESECAPSLGMHDGRLFVAWKGSGNDNLNIARVVLFGNTAGGFGIEGLENKVTLADTSEAAPAIASHGGLLVYAWQGEAEENIDLRVSRDGRFSPQGPWFIRNRSELGFYLVAYRTPPAIPDELVKPVNSLGFAYIVEKSDMDALGISFEEFEARVRESNTHLPAQLRYGDEVEFNAPIGNVISCWFELTGLKYTPRVVDTFAEFESFTELPLVSGDLMNSAGHSGLITFTAPGADIPAAVLDFSVADQPAMHVEHRRLPDPWVDRVSAGFDLAAHFQRGLTTINAGAARADAASEYSRLLRLDSDVFGQLLAPKVIAALDAMRVDFSVPRADLLDFLANPLFTPYPAIAQSLLSLGKKLAAPIFIDVIVFNYENTPGVASPREAADVDLEVLRAALIEGWNVRHGDDVTIDRFAEILE